MAQSRLHRRTVHTLPPRLEELKALLLKGPRTIEQLSTEMEPKKDGKMIESDVVRSYLSKLAKVETVIVNFAYKNSTYEISAKK
jgi:hypothetical protein